MEPYSSCFDPVPNELKDLPRWVCWRLEKRNGKDTKVPYVAATGRRAKVTDRNDWCAFGDALRAYQTPDSRFDGVGFVFSVGDGCVGVDLDDCVGGDGAVAPWARDIIASLDSYSEISPSGTGVKVFLRGSFAARSRRRKGSIEMYGDGRYFTVTGRHLGGTPTELKSRQPELNALYDRTFGPAAGAGSTVRSEDHPVIHREPARLSDDEVLARCRRAKNSAKFERLWSGDASGYAVEGNAGESEADLALCAMLAFYTGPDAAQIDRLFRQSGLCRGKWTDREDYRRRTIDRALSGGGDSSGRASAPARSPDSTPPESDRVAAADSRGEVGATIADAIVAYADSAGVECFHGTGSDPVAYVSFVVGDHTECWRVRANRFARWLARTHYEATGRLANEASMGTAVEMLEARGLFSGSQADVFLRLGMIEADGARRVYVDLGDASWRVVEIDGQGWRVLDRSPVKFRRTTATGALPIPERGGAIDLLRPFVNAADDDSFKLMVGFAIACFMPNSGYPLLVLTGEAGSAKSTTARALRDVTDPSPIPMRGQPRSEHELFIAAGNSRVLVFDNLSRVTDDFSDSLCKLATGGGFGARKLYSDDDEVLISASAPIILTGIDELTDREDFLSRAIRVVQPAIDKRTRKPERQLRSEFARVRGRIFGALLDAVSSALRHQDGVRPSHGELERMADFCAWVTGAEHALGWEPGSIVDAFRRMQEDSVEAAFEANLFARAVCSRVQGQSEWRGTATDLLRTAAMAEGATQGPRLPALWPKSPNMVMGALRRAAEGLRRRGITFEQIRENDAGRARTIVIRWEPTRSIVQSVRTVQRPEPRTAGTRSWERPAPRESSGSVQTVTGNGTAAHSGAPRGGALDDPDASDETTLSLEAGQAHAVNERDVVSDDADGPGRRRASEG